MSIKIIIGLIILVLIIIIFTMGYLKAPPDMAYLVSGLGKKPKIVIGSSTIRIPFLERVDRLPLSLMQVDIKTSSAVPTNEFINIFVDGVANIKIGSDTESIQKAAQNFLGRSKKEIANVAQEVLEGNMREIVGQMQLKELVQQREKFAKMVEENAMDDMMRMGLVIINLNVQNFSDKNGVIENLGMENVSKIQKEASIAKANANRDVAVATSKANEEANKAKVESDEQIAIQDSTLIVKKSELKLMSDAIQAKADAAYEIQKAEELLTIGVAQSNAEIAKREKEIILQEKEIIVNEKRLESEFKQKADAEKYVQERNAESREYQRRKEADGEKYAKEQEAIGIKAIGSAEALTIQAKAEAMEKMGSSSTLEMYLNVLPEIMKNVAEPLSKTEKIVLYGDGNATKLIGDIMSSTDKVIEALSQSTGIDIRKSINNVLPGEKNPNNEKLTEIINSLEENNIDIDQIVDFLKENKGLVRRNIINVDDNNEPV